MCHDHDQRDHLQIGSCSESQKYFSLKLRTTSFERESTDTVRRCKRSIISIKGCWKGSLFARRNPFNKVNTISNEESNSTLPFVKHIPVGAA